MKSQNRKKILAEALKVRENEVMHYQINIDNYELALIEIQKLSPDEQLELQQFTNQLRSLLNSEKLEQKKSRIMLSVLKQQLE